MLRKHYRIKPRISFNRASDGVICLLPTFIFQHWEYRRIGSPVVTFSWFNMCVCFGEWVRR